MLEFACIHGFLATIIATIRRIEWPIEADTIRANAMIAQAKGRTTRANARAAHRNRYDDVYDESSHGNGSNGIESAFANHTRDNSDSRKDRRI